MLVFSTSCPKCGATIYFTAPVGPVTSIPLECNRCKFKWDYKPK